ncbi:MAG: ATP-binding protein, partial [Bacteroidota bacterium]|nr:ATP-binding protein [Bacteroidota bacterium]
LALVSIVLALLSSLYFIITITKRISKMVNLAEDISKGVFKTLDDPGKDELNKLAVSLNAMSKTLEKNFNDLTKKNKELDEFAYVVSHDLKAPLRGISNIISWIEEDHEHEISPEIKRNLILIKGRATRLENMINGLLEYARVSKGKKEIQKFKVTNLVNEIVDILVPKSYIVLVDDKMPELVTEKLLMEQIFSNLISNAVKYNDKSVGRITIISNEFPDYYEFSVSDNGMGIQSEYFDKIFVIFQTLQERDAFESTGVGLAIIKKIIEDHKGAIRVKSEFGEGSIFTFTWPKHTEKLN